MKRYYDGGRPPKGVPSTLVNLEGRTFSLLPPVQRKGDIHVRDERNRVFVLERGANIIMCRHRPHWEQSKDCLVPLDKTRDGLYFMKGHGSKK